MSPAGGGQALVGNCIGTDTLHKFDVPFITLIGNLQPTGFKSSEVCHYTPLY